jgi:hypothetical protein
MRVRNVNTCTGDINHLRPVRQGLLLCLIAGLLGCLTGLPTEMAASETLAVIERDTLQARYLVPVINHDTMIVNLTVDPFTISLHSGIPAGKYVKDSPLSAFGRNSLLSVPMFAPFTVPIKNSIILENPQVSSMGQQIFYCWGPMIVPSGYAVRAQYDNYYAAGRDFYRDHGMDIPGGLRIKSKYTVNSREREKESSLYHLGLDLLLKNEGKQDIEDMFFRVFVPAALALEAQGDLHHLVEPVEIWFSDNLTVTTSSITDGFGNAAQGIDASVQIGTLKAGDSFLCALQVDCTRKTEEGDIYPIFSILGRSQLGRLWPPTIIKGVPPGNQKQFHYILYNLVIGARRIFHMDKNGISVIRAETSKRYRSLLPQ